MTITVDWTTKIVNSTASITDIVEFKNILRDLEDDAEGIIHPAILSYKRLDLGGGAFFHAVDFINGYQLRFPNPGNYSIIGNIGVDIVPVAGVFVDRTKSAAFATVSSGGGIDPALAIKIDELHKIMGLDAASPMTVTPSSRVAGSINQTITGDGENISIVTRQ